MPDRKHVAVVTDLTSEYDRSVVHGITRFVQEERQWIIYLRDDPRHKIAQLQRWQGHGVIANIEDPNVVEAVKQLGVPVVGFGGSELNDDQIYFLQGDNKAIARMAAEHLLERGFTSFAYCGWPSTRILPWSPARARFFSQFVREAGFHCEVYTTRSAPNWSRLLADLSQWLQSLKKPVGLMAANDARARHVLEACRQLGAAVPDEVAVIGVDNNELICNLSMPPLSSIIPGGERLGYEAGVLLKKLMAGKARRNVNLPVIPPAGVVTRQSTDTLAISDPDVAAAVQFIRQNAVRPVQVRDVVAHVSMSRATLENRFKDVVGRTIHKEIRRVQIREVQHLLRSTELPLHKIAERTGFRYVQYLAAVFRQACGQTPGQYRDHLRREKR